MSKLFVNSNQFFSLSLDLAKKIVSSNFKCDVVLGVSRGGCIPGIIVHEYLNYKGVKCDYSNVYNGRFVHMDDIEFSKKFIEYVNKHNLQKTIDVLFIDTSHMYEHTKKEIECWFPFLSDNAIVIFHDTNMPGVFHKSMSWDNNR